MTLFQVKSQANVSLLPGVRIINGVMEGGGGGRGEEEDSFFSPLNFNNNFKENPRDSCCDSVSE